MADPNWRRAERPKNCKACGTHFMGRNRRIICIPCRDTARRSRPGYHQKNKARQAAQNAIRDGILIRGNCLVCDEPNGEAHHENYADPLNVTWLCPQCHQRRHYDLKNGRGASDISEWIKSERDNPKCRFWRVERIAEKIKWTIRLAGRTKEEYWAKHGRWVPYA